MAILLLMDCVYFFSHGLTPVRFSGPTGQARMNTDRGIFGDTLVYWFDSIKAMDILYSIVFLATDSRG